MKLKIKVIISPTHTCNSEDSDNDEPPLVKRRRLQNLQKEREEEKFRLEQPAFTGLDDVQGPASQQVLKPVVSVRRRLDFSQTLTQTTSSDDSSHESIDNLFASDSSSSESEQHEKEFACAHSFHKRDVSMDQRFSILLLIVLCM
ncbi:hypothetical protein RRG08_032099 [Elysia crispata]|uniref:Uncharacterized protein n=1 Tax=Elysia crispata TaxID=231223 RepID=A0AAE0ZDG8_9GAST|nr:hypothetical protein RRG08_032099 [Elysia crispata]